MQDHVDSALKFDLQHNYRRYLRHLEQYSAEASQLRAAKSSRVWIIGIVLLFFALASDFFLGASAGLFGLYFYRVFSAWLAVNNAEEGREQADRWFSSKGFKFEGKVMYFRDDETLEKPLDPFDDTLYN